MEVIIFIVIIYFIFLSNSGKKTKKTGGRNIMNELNNLLTEGANKLENQVSNENHLKEAILESRQSPKQQARRKKVNLYKKNISIPINIIAGADAKSLGVNIFATIYIKDVNQYKLIVGSDDKKVADIIVYHIYKESGNMNINDLMEPTILEEKVKRLAELDLAFMGISRINLEIEVKSILQDNISNNSVESYIYTDREEDYAKQITDELMGSIGIIEKDIEKSVKDIEKDMDDFVKSLSAGY